ncbi:heavy metal translocatin [Auriculariales sp. MPI-PUGE-AT-0066]|nr:heavy metal translocatin [Auriculariales sp. MPI-PUGE-AT-0066]
MSLAIEGMDCPSCASKVTRALSSVRSVHNVKVNVFVGQASLAYVEGHAFPADIAKRATELTGFSCSVIDTVQTQGERSSMRIHIPTAFESSFSKDALPTGITVLSMKGVHDGMLLEAEYNSLVVRPREVLDSFQRWRGEFVPTPKIRAGDVANKELRNMFRRTGLSSLLCLPILILSWAPLPDHPKAYGAVMLALGAIIQTYIAAPVYSAGFRSLFFQHTLDMDVLIGLSSGIAFAFSSVSYFLLVAGHEFSEPFFETSAILITLIMLGRFISAYARRRATSALDELYSLQIDTVTLVSTDGAGTRTTRSISSELVHKGDILRVDQAAVVPTDGTVVESNGYVDESCITGESMPVDKSPGSALTAGTKNGDTELFVRVDRLPSDNTVAEISQLMLEVQNQRLRVQDLADKAASWLAPTILAVGITTFLVWVAVGLRVRNDSASTACVAALRYAISVMVVSCPCALVLCVPMVVVISTAVASKSGVLFKSAEAIQSARTSKAIIFDKTKTLTLGVLSVAEGWLQDDSVVSVLLALVSGSHHPVSQAVHGHLFTKYPEITPAKVADISSLPGQGLECMINGAAVRGGNPRWLGLETNPHISEMLNKAFTIFAVSIDGTLVAAFGLIDTPRVDAQATIDFLTARKVEVYIVSGDAQPVVDALAKDLGIPAKQAFGGCLPQDKLARVKELQRAPDTGKKRNVIFVGDGTNDALALAQADVGVSFSTGTSVAASAAGILLLTPSLATAFKTIFSISTGATRRIWINFGWAFVYNLLAVLGAAGAFVHWSIPPEYAGLGEMVSVVPVVLVAWSIWLLKRTPA